MSTPDQILTLEQVREVVAGMQRLELPPRVDDLQRYRWIDAALTGLRYRTLSRGERGLVLGYLRRLTGYSRAQVTRLVARWIDGQPMAKHHTTPAHAFARHYQAEDVALLAEVDRLFGRLSGPVTVCLLRHLRDRHGDSRFGRLGGVSASHLYQLRRSAAYAAVAGPATRPCVPPRRWPVGVARGVAPDAAPGHIDIERVEPVEGCTDVWLVVAVDRVTQWQVMLAVPSTLLWGSSAWALLCARLRTRFPFPVTVVCTDAVDEAVVDRLPASLGRPAGAGRDTAHDGLAAAVDTFYREAVEPFANLHRPVACAAGRQAARAADLLTPLDRLAALPDGAAQLRPGLSIAALTARSRSASSLQVAARLRRAQAELAQLLTDSR